jgi:hypothetical protein
MILSSAHEMDDFKRIAPFEQRRTVGFAGNDIAVEFDHDAAGTDLQLFEELGNAQPLGNLLFFSIDVNFHENEKNRIRADHLTVAREYGFKRAPSVTAKIAAFAGL